MEIVNFQPWLGLTSGMLVGLAGVLLMGLNGRIAGISGILGGLLPPTSDLAWRIAFIAGLILGGLGFALLGGNVAEIQIDANMPTLIVAGLVVGFGTRLGHGCTSGHGVCGVGRLSQRGLIATVTFLVVGALTVFITHHVIGG